MSTRPMIAGGTCRRRGIETWNTISLAELLTEIDSNPDDITRLRVIHALRGVGLAE
jgi:hypothetical protein